MKPQGKYNILWCLGNETKRLELTIPALTHRDSSVCLCDGEDPTVREVTGKTLKKTPKLCTSQPSAPGA